MKTTISKLLVITALLTAQFAQAQQPPLVNCLTNFQLVITATNVITTQGTNLNSVFTGAGLVNTTLACDTYGTAFMLSGPCSPTAQTVGYYTWQCDTSRTCPGVQGAPTACTSGGTEPLILPAYTSTIMFSFRTYLCCNVIKCDLFSYGCQPGGGGGGGE